MWLIFAFLSAALLGLYDVFKKQSLRGNAVIPILFINTLICGSFFLPFILLSAMGKITPDSPLYLPSGHLTAHGYVLIKSAIVLASWLCGYFAIKHLPLTIAGPINATRPVMTLTGALMIYGEELNLWQWAGVILSVFSLFLLSRNGRKEGIHFSHNRWIFLLIIAAILGATSGLFDKFLMSSPQEGGVGLHPLFVQGWYNLYQAAMMLMILFTLWYPHRKTSTPFQWKWSILFISLFLTAADLAYFYALSQPESMISLISMVRRSSVLVSFVFGALVFQEKNIKDKALDLLLILMGMICIYYGNSL